MPKSNKIDNKAKAFIRENWHKLSLREIASKLGVYPRTIVWHGKKMQLGEKPVTEKKEPDETPQSTQLAGGEVSFVDMLLALCTELEQTRASLIAELEALRVIPPDSDGKLDHRQSQIELQLEKVEKRCVKYEELKMEVEQVVGSTKPVDGRFDRMEDLISFLNENNQRQSEGRLMEKVRIAAERVRDEWSQLRNLGERELDQVLLNSDTIYRDEENAKSA